LIEIVTVGGRKSEAHIAGQNRLERIFQAKKYETRQEEKVVTFEGKEYWLDVFVFIKIENFHTKIDEVPIMGLEVDTYEYGSQKKKSPRHIRNRDSAIMETLSIPVVRIDVDALKEGRRKTKYYLSDAQIFNHCNMKLSQYKNNPVQYMNEAQRG
jgi:hypothetical protein